MEGRKNGALISMENGKAVAFAILIYNHEEKCSLHIMIQSM